MALGDADQILGLTAFGFRPEPERGETQPGHNAEALDPIMSGRIEPLKPSHVRGLTTDPERSEGTYMLGMSGRAPMRMRLGSLIIFSSGPHPAVAGRRPASSVMSGDNDGEIPVRHFPNVRTTIGRLGLGSVCVRIRADAALEGNHEIGRLGVLEFPHIVRNSRQ